MSAGRTRSACAVVYELERLDFAERYPVAEAETMVVNRIASFDRAIDRVSTVERIEPPAT